METHSLSLDEIFAIARRRWRPVLLLVLMVSTVAAFAAFLWPPTYRSEAIILIEEPDVPRELVQSTITSFADQRVQVITQHVMTSRNLSNIINKFNLYPDARQTAPASELAEAMREDIRLEMVSAEVIDPRSGRPTQATIAFELSFDHREAEVAQAVLNELVTLYLGENLRTRRETAAQTTGFLSGEAARLSARISDLESRLAEFKAAHAGQLPEVQATNQQIVQRLDRDLMDLRRRIQSLTERRIYLETELTQIEPTTPLVVDGQKLLGPEDQLSLLETQLASLRGTYGPRHPDILRLEREVESMRAQVGGDGGASALDQQIEVTKAALVEARKTYSETHPDVIKLLRQLAALEDERLQLPDDAEPIIRVGGRDNPAYIQLQAQLEVVNSDLRSYREQAGGLQTRLDAIEETMRAAPEVEREYLMLQRDYEENIRNYREVQDKLTAAKLGEALEVESKSERFSLIEPPNAPIAPIKPNRRAILMLGFVLAMSSGVGVGVLMESMDGRIYGSQQILRLTGASPLVVVPSIRTSGDTWRTRGRALAWLLAAAAAVAGAVALVNIYVMPIDVLWAVLQQKLPAFLQAGP